MAHFAELNENNEVIYVAYMDNEIITDENGNEVEELGIQHLHTHHGSHRRWIRTSYGGNFRGKAAGEGDIYREDLDLFICPQPYPSWVLNEDTRQWEAPVSKPENYFSDDYEWIEESQSWFSIREYVYNKYAKNYDYDHIKNAVELFNLKEKEIVPVTFVENYTVAYEKEKNFILSHQWYQKWSRSVLNEWKNHYMNIIMESKCDLFCVKKINNVKEKKKFDKYMTTVIDFVFLEEKNNWAIYKRDKYVA
jgi:hypothetical protein